MRLPFRRLYPQPDPHGARLGTDRPRCRCRTRETRAPARPRVAAWLPGARPESGQGTVEWVALLLVVSIASLAILTAVAGPFGALGLVRAISAQLLCAADLSSSCSANGALVRAYGSEIAATVADNAPEIDYEEGMTELPIDFRSCRSTSCGNGAHAGSIEASDRGEPAAAFVHVVDCRTSRSRAENTPQGYVCSGERAGNLYVQYWLYYPDSSTSPWTHLPGRPGFHADDWEGYQLRIGVDGTDARATSHQGYAYRGGPTNWPSDAGLVGSSAWGDATGRLYVSGGSHAGHVYEPRSLSVARGARTAGRAGEALAGEIVDGRRPPPRTLRVTFTYRRPPSRWTPGGDLRLIPTETLDAGARRTRFAITPPWRKPVFWDPEDQGT